MVKVDQRKYSDLPSCVPIRIMDSNNDVLSTRVATAYRYFRFNFKTPDSGTFLLLLVLLVLSIDSNNDVGHGVFVLDSPQQIKALFCWHLIQ